MIAGVTKTPPTPLATDPVADSDAEVIRRELMSPWTGHITTPPLTAMYRLNLLLAAIALLLLPLIYFALIAALGYFVFWYAQHGLVLFDDTGRRHSSSNAKGSFVAYVGPLFIGGTLLVFMIKPLFSRRKDASHPLTLSRSEQPMLFEFVDRLARYIGAPSPSRIEVDLDVNAHARFRRGLLSIAQRDLVLRIGLPLASNLPVRNFAGVLAHEFGHFAQRGGMSLTYIIRSVSNWFARVVYQRDSWDAALDGLARNGGYWPLIIVAHLARLFVYLTRKLLWCLMMAGHAIASLLLRQMEFDADRYETIVAGSKAFAETSRSLKSIGVATHQAYDSIRSSWEERRLPDNFPALIAQRHSKLPPEVAKKLDEITAAAKTGWLDTHPADRERIAAAAALNTEGTFKSSLPATALFSDFPELAKRATLAHYFDILGPQVKPENLTPVEAVIARDEKEEGNFEALGRFIQGVITPTALAAPREAIAAPKDTSAAVDRLVELRNQLRELAPAARAALKSIEDAREEAAKPSVVRTLQSAGYKKIKVAAMGMKRGDDAELAELTKQSQARIAASEPAVRAAQSVAIQRLVLALGLGLAEDAKVSGDVAALAEPTDAKELEDRGEYDLVAEPLPDQTMSLAATLSQLDSLQPRIRDLIEANQRLQLLLNQLSDRENPKSLIDAIMSRGRKMHEGLSVLVGDLPKGKYPFEHADPRASVASYLAGGEALPTKEEPIQIFNFAAGLIGHYFELYGRILSELVRRAEAVEERLGLPPLEPFVAEPDPRPAQTSA